MALTMKLPTTKHIALVLWAITLLLASIMLWKWRPDDPRDPSQDTLDSAPLDLPRTRDHGSPAENPSRLEVSQPGSRATAASLPQPPATRATRAGRILITDLARVDAQYVQNVETAFRKTGIPINLREVDLPPGVWTELASLGQRASRDLYELQKEKSPLMAREFDRMREAGEYLEFKSYDLESDPRERSRLREEIAAAARPGSDIEQVSMSAGGGKTRVYKHTPVPGTELHRVVADQQRCLRNVGQAAAALVLPFMQRPHRGN